MLVSRCVNKEIQVHLGKWNRSENCLTEIANASWIVGLMFLVNATTKIVQDYVAYITLVSTIQLPLPKFSTTWQFLPVQVYLSHRKSAPIPKVSQESLKQSRILRTGQRPMRIVSRQKPTKSVSFRWGDILGDFDMSTLLLIPKGWLKLSMRTKGACVWLKWPQSFPVCWFSVVVPLCMTTALDEIKMSKCQNLID